MAEIKLVFKDEISDRGEPAVSIALEDVDGGLDDAELTGELTPAQIIAVDAIQGLEFAANEIYEDGELVGGLSLNRNPEEEH